MLIQRRSDNVANAYSYSPSNAPNMKVYTRTAMIGTVNMTIGVVRDIETLKGTAAAR
jgi:hypothetical protein